MTPFPCAFYALSGFARSPCYCTVGVERVLPRATNRLHTSRGFL